MATLTPVNGDLTAGIAGKSEDILNPRVPALVTGDFPQVASTDENVAESQTLEALTVVGFDSNGRIVPAVLGGGSPIAPIGVLAYATTTGVGVSGVYAGVYRTGVFNPDLLVWDASFSTDAEKAKAFEGAPSPTQIIIRKPKAKTV